MTDDQDTYGYAIQTFSDPHDPRYRIRVETWHRDGRIERRETRHPVREDGSLGVALSAHLWT